MGTRWVVLRVLMNADGIKASEVLGDDIIAPDKASALEHAQRLYPKVIGEVVVVSRLSWDMSMEEKARLDRRKKALWNTNRGRADRSRKS